MTDAINSDTVAKSPSPFGPNTTSSMGRTPTTNRVTVLERISYQGHLCFELFIPAHEGHKSNQAVKFQEQDNPVLMNLFRDLPKQTKFNCDLRVTWAHVKGWAVASKVEIVQKLTPQGGNMGKKPQDIEYTPPSQLTAAASTATFMGTQPKSELDEHMPRTADNKPCADWVLNDKERGAFMAKWAGLCAHYDIAQTERETVRHEILTALTGQQSLKGWAGTQDDLLEKMEAYIVNVIKRTPIDASTPADAPSKPASTPEPADVGTPSAPVETDTLADKIKEVREKFNAPQRGKAYLTVQGRIAIFRLKFPMGTIDTELVDLKDDAAVFKARVAVDGVVMATGYARATAKSTQNLGSRYIEKAETAAVGRALAMAGFGTDDTLDDADFLADSPTPVAA